MDIVALKGNVEQVVRDGPLKDRIDAVVVEADRDDDGTEFLRVVLHVDPRAKSTDAELVSLLELIERSVANVDDRYASVRFSDAA